MVTQATTSKLPFRWRVIGKSVRGAAHVRDGKPNQDAMLWAPETGEGPPLVVAIADGHGSEKSFRSDLGAQFGVQAALTVMKQFIAGQPVDGGVSLIKQFVEDQLPRHVVQAWTEFVSAHLAEHPFTDDDWTRLLEKGSAKDRATVEGHPTLAYGATLLAAVIAESYILYFQLGDGDILCVTHDGETLRPLPVDERLIANETTSLCQRDAWKEVRAAVVPIVDLPPAMILLSTDGYKNSFASSGGDDKEFLQIGQDYLQLARSEGLVRLEQNLSNFLHQSSERSGDDVTLALVKLAEPIDIDTITQRIAAVEKGLATKPDQADLQEVAASESQARSALEERITSLDERITSVFSGMAEVSEQLVAPYRQRLDQLDTELAMLLSLCESTRARASRLSMALCLLIAAQLLTVALSILLSYR